MPFTAPKYSHWGVFTRKVQKVLTLFNITFALSKVFGSKLWIFVPTMQVRVNELDYCFFVLTWLDLKDDLTPLPLCEAAHHGFQFKNGSTSHMQLVSTRCCLWYRATWPTQPHSSCGASSCCERRLQHRTGSHKTFPEMGGIIWVTPKDLRLHIEPARDKPSLGHQWTILRLAPFHKTVAERKDCEACHVTSFASFGF